jgi:hypothetical protein
MNRCVKFSIIPVFLLSELSYCLYFVGLSVGCSGTSQGYYAASHPICQAAGDQLFSVDMFVIAPLIVAIWFLTLQKAGKWGWMIRGLGMVYLLGLRFGIMTWLSKVEIDPGGGLG